jgi:hypothetical protein
MMDMQCVRIFGKFLRKVFPTPQKFYDSDFHVSGINPKPLIIFFADSDAVSEAFSVSLKPNVKEQNAYPYAQ